MALENDELSYSSEDILQVCLTAGVPTIFDAHHHLVKEKSESYDCPSLEHYVSAVNRQSCEKVVQGDVCLW
ncbi:MAG: hypothetical protein K2X93_13630 [Candidatus Obscuribacterales bacterium]|nr:hypothetical protein [Candidatus Obscuribacterales bacterium]